MSTIRRKRWNRRNPITGLEEEVDSMIEVLEELKENNEKIIEEIKEIKEEIKIIEEPKEEIEEVEVKRFKGRPKKGT